MSRTHNQLISSSAYLIIIISFFKKYVNPSHVISLPDYTAIYGNRYKCVFRNCSLSVTKPNLKRSPKRKPTQLAQLPHGRGGRGRSICE
jgi:hypothetical protein